MATLMPPHFISVFVLTATSCVAGVALAATAPAASGPAAKTSSRNVMGHGAIAGPLNQQEVTASYTRRYALEFAAAPVTLLPPIDEVDMMLEDDNMPQPAPLRFAVQRPIDVSISDGQWINVPGGRIWRLDVEGIGSLNTRMHLSGLDLGEGQEIFLDSASDANDSVGPLTGKGDFSNGEAWGAFTPGAVARIEWFVPEGSNPTTLPFETAEYSQGYRDIFGIFADEVSMLAQCHNDPVCYASWTNQSNAAAKMTFTSGGGSYLCSGQLMATTAADETPYFSTAYHCISTQTEANSLNARFFYRASTCNGSNNAGTNVVGADLVSTYSASDATLLMIRGALPSSVYWVGSLTTNPATTTPIVSIHHPGGAEQDISFGTKTYTTANCGSPSSNWHRVGWTTGITEGGSSGSALYVESSQLLCGLLTCGTSSCTITAGWDGYSRWDLAMGTGGFSSFIAAGTDDTQEPNDSCAAARLLTPATYSALVVKRLDSDWYAIDVPIGSTLVLSSTYTHTNGDVDFRLWSGCGGTLLQDRTGNVNNEGFTYVNTSSSTRLLLEAYLSTDTRNDYSMIFSVTTPAPANNECSGATTCTDGTVGFSTAGATNSSYTIPASCNVGGGTAINKDVWFGYTASCTGTATASTCGQAGFDTNIAVYSGPSCPGASSTVLACNDNGSGCSGSTSSVYWDAVAGQTYFIRVGSPGTGSGSGSLTMSCVNLCPADLDGDSAVGGSDVALLLLDFGPCAGCSADLDGDNDVTGSDLAYLLLDFGNCP